MLSDISDLKEKEENLEARNAELQKIQTDLKASEERVAKIIQSSPDGIITMSQRGIIQTFSPSAEPAVPACANWMPVVSPEVV